MVTRVKDNSTLILNHINQGNCIDILANLPEKSVDLVFADPPYNLQLQGDLLRPNARKVDGVSDEWDQFADFSAYDEFTRKWLSACQRVLKDTGTLWVIGSYHNIYRVGAILQDLGFWILNDVVWKKTNALPHFRGVRFNNSHETLLWCKKSKDQKKYTFHYHSMKFMNDEKQMQSVWEIPICTGSERLKVDGKKVHPTQKPEALLYRIIISSSDPGDTILDPFFGSGTTGAVAKKLGRNFVGIEEDADYIAASSERIHHIPVTSLDKQILGSFPNKRNEPRIPFATLLEQGLLIPGQSLFLDRDREKKATILANGYLRTVDGSIGSIHKIGCLLSQTSECNGWLRWFFEKEDQLLVIDTLREEFRQRIKVAEIAHETAS
jgi:DNA modification methylase